MVPHLKPLRAANRSIGQPWKIQRLSLSGSGLSLANVLPITCRVHPICTRTKKHRLTLEGSPYVEAIPAQDAKDYPSLLIDKEQDQMQAWKSHGQTCNTEALRSLLRGRGTEEDRKLDVYSVYPKDDGPLIAISEMCRTSDHDLLLYLRTQLLHVPWDASFELDRYHELRTCCGMSTFVCSETLAVIIVGGCDHCWLL